MLGFLATPATWCFLSLAYVPLPLFHYEIEHDWTVTIGGEWHGVRQIASTHSGLGFTSPFSAGSFVERRTQVRIGSFQTETTWKATELAIVATLILVVGLAGGCYAIGQTRGGRGGN